MIARLRRRMILLVLAGLLLAAAGVVAAINIMNWGSMTGQVNAVLDQLAENNGQRPDGDFGRFSQGKQEEKPFGARRGADMADAVSLSNYYTVALDASGAVTGWFSDRADVYSEDEVLAMAEAAMARGAGAGRLGSQFYRLAEQADGTYLLIVVNAQLEYSSFLGTLRTTALVALAEYVLLSLGAVWLIRRMVRPVAEAMEKQKQFVWDASHELKTPLAVIGANAELLSREAGESQPLTYIRSEVERTDKLLQSLLTLARMDRGTVAAERRPFDLSRAVLSVTLPFESAVFEAGKTLETDIPEGITLRGDEEMIRQLAVILLSNALKYSDAGGRIRVSLAAHGEKRVLAVHNTGPAIPKEALPRVFDRFYRVDSSHNRELPGSGLGLAIARSIVDAHHGKIAVASAEGEGTAFTVTLNA